MPPKLEIQPSPPRLEIISAPPRLEFDPGSGLPHRRSRGVAVSAAALGAGLLIPAFAFTRAPDAAATTVAEAASALATAMTSTSTDAVAPGTTATPGSEAIGTVAETTGTETTTGPAAATASGAPASTTATTTPTTTTATSATTSNAPADTTTTTTSATPTDTTASTTTSSTTSATPTETTATSSTTSTTTSATVPAPRHRRRHHRRGRGRGRGHRHPAPRSGPHHGAPSTSRPGQGQRHHTGHRRATAHTAPAPHAQPVVSPAPAPLTISAAPGPSLFPNPLTSAQLERFAALVSGAARPPNVLERIYRQAGRHFGVPWQVLAAINYVETDYGRDLAVSSAGAVGWMQFMPGTWMEYGVAVDDRGRLVSGIPDPWQPRDAIFTAARYLKASGASHNLARAIYAYNHAGWYVAEVMTIAAEIDEHGLRAGSKARRKIAAMRTMARLLNGLPYVWGGGHGGWSITGGYDCSGFVSAVLHSAGYLSIPVTTQSLPGQSRILSGPGRWVTIFDRTDAGLGDDHVIIDIEGQWWESGGGGLDGAPRVHRIRHLGPGYLQTFNLVLHPKGL